MSRWRLSRRQIRSSSFLSSIANLSNNMISAENTQCLVFLDLESTGLYNKQVYRPGPHNPRITELGLLAVTRDTLSQPQAFHKRELPRTAKELTFQVNPGPDTFWDATSMRISGLNPDLVANEEGLRHWWGQVIGFLERLPQPFTLVAHGGNDFDFRLLRDEMARLNLAPLPNNPFSADSYRLLKELDRRRQMARERPEEQVAEGSGAGPLPETPTKTPLKVAQPIASQAAPMARYTINNGLEQVEPAKRPRLETTPVKAKYSFNGQETRVEYEFPTPPQTEQAPPPPPPPPPVARPVRRVLQFGGAPGGYSLKALYERVTGEAEIPGHHQALDDCRALLQICVHFGPEFLTMVDELKERL